MLGNCSGNFTQDNFVLTCNLISFSMYKGYKGFVCIRFRFSLLYGMNANEEIHVFYSKEVELAWYALCTSLRVSNLREY